MSSVSSARTDLVASFPSQAGARLLSRENVPGVAVLSILLAAVIWAAFAQARSTPLPGEAGPEADAITIVD
jgi:hypothetical protein